VKHEQIATFVEHARDEPELIVLGSSPRLLRVADDPTHATDAQSIDDDGATVEQMHVFREIGHAIDIVVVARDADDPWERRGERFPDRCDVTEATALVRAGHAVKVAREHDAGPRGAGQGALGRELDERLGDGDSEQLAGDDALQIAAAHDRVELVGREVGTHPRKREARDLRAASRASVHVTNLEQRLGIDRVVQPQHAWGSNRACERRLGKRTSIREMIGRMPLPKPGAVFLVPITDTLNTFAWVAGPFVIPDNPYKRVILACAAWTGPDLPTRRDLDSRRVRELFDIKGKSFGPLVIYTHEPVPRQWKRIGTVTKPGVTATPLWDGGLDNIQFYVERMWQAKHDPASIAEELAEQAALDAEDAVENAAVARLLAARKKGPLAKLAKLDLLPEWDGLATKRRKTTVERWLHECVANLRALPRTAKRAAKLAVIEASVERVNDWSGCDEIDTPEREALCTAFDDIGHAAGIRGHDLAGPYRDW
jgi:hypothetical protein